MLLIVIALTISFVGVNCQTGEGEDLTQRQTTKPDSLVWKDITSHENSVENLHVTSRGAVARRMCNFYANSVSNLGISPTPLDNRYPLDRLRSVNEPKINGGTKAKLKEFPHMAAVGYDVPKRGKLWRCGGTLLTDRFILTSAYCLWIPEYGHAVFARHGDLNMMTDEHNATAQERIIADRIPHPLFENSTGYNDIGLLNLSRPISINNFVLPACLPTELDLLTTPNAYATGWGKTDLNDKGSNDLLKVEVKFVDIDTCNAIWVESNDDRLPYGLVGENQLCAGESGKGICEGDYGGPLVVRISGPLPIMHEVIGVTSISKWCGSPVPSVYTKVSAYLDWLESTIWPDKFNQYYNK